MSFLGKIRARDKPAEKRSAVGYVIGSDGWNTICSSGYTRLTENPEVLAAVGRIAELISTMPIHINQNTPDGDIRVKNGLSRKLDIEPNPYMTRKTLVETIVKNMLLYGEGNAVVVPKTKDGLLDSLTPLAPYRVGFMSDGAGYKIAIDGVSYAPEDLLHFVTNPDPNQPWKGTGYRVSLQSVVKNLQQAASTKNAFMSSEWKPPLIIRVEGESSELVTPDGRRALLDRYIKPSQPGEPWIVPSEQFDVVQVKPLTLNDLAISDTVKMDKQTVAAIIGVPSFVVGAGAFNQQEWNNFISTKILPIVRGIEQELTRKILIAPDLFITMNPWALYAYDLKDLASIGGDLYVRGLMDGNEVRSWVNMEPREGLNELVILENYIPRGMIGDQKKLNQEGGNEGGN